MTIASEVSRSGPYPGNGVATVFDYDFRIVDQDHLQVIKADATGDETTLVIATDYMVSGVGADSGSITTTVAPVTGETITILRAVPFVQETDLENQGPYLAQTVEDALDLAAMRDQQLAEQLERAVKVPASSDDTGGELSAQLAQGILRLADSADEIDAVAAIEGDVTIVAGIAADVALLADSASILSGTASAIYAVEDTFVGDGVDTTWVLSTSPPSEANVDVWVGGAIQKNEDISIVGNVLTITPAVANGVEIVVKTRVYVSANDVYEARDEALEARDQAVGAVADIVNGPNFMVMKRSEASAVLMTLKERHDKEFAPLIEWTGKISDPNDTDAYTTAIAAAFDEVKNLGLFIPPGRYPFTSLTWPNVEGFSVIGSGNKSVLVQKGLGIKFPARATTNLNANGLISNLCFDGRDGTGHTIDTTYAQTLEFADLFMTEVPNGYSSIKVDGNPNDGTYMHDVRLNRLRMYHTNGYVPPDVAANPHPLAFIELGPLVADSEIIGCIAQGFKDLDYIVLARSGAQTTRLVGNHLYNTRKNIVRLEGGNSDFSFTDNTFDYCDEDNVRIIGGTKNRFVGNFFQFIKAGFSGLLLDNSYRTTLTNSAFSAETVAEACVKEINGSSDNKIVGGIIDDWLKYTEPFQMSGDRSYATGFADDTPFGNHCILEGVVASPIARNTSAALGVHGAGAVINTNWRKKYPGRILSAWVILDAAPTTAQVFNIKRNGATVATITVPAGQFSGDVRVPVANQRWGTGGASIYIEYVGNGDAGSFSPYYGIEVVE